MKLLHIDDNEGVDDDAVVAVAANVDSMVGIGLYPVRAIKARNTESCCFRNSSMGATNVSISRSRFSSTCKEIARTLSTEDPHSISAVSSSTVQLALGVSNVGAENDATIFMTV